MGDIRRLALAIPVINLEEDTAINPYIGLFIAFGLAFLLGRWLGYDPNEHSSRLYDSNASPSHPHPIGPRAAMRVALARHGGGHRRELTTFSILEYNSVKETRREL